MDIYIQLRVPPVSGMSLPEPTVACHTRCSVVSIKAKTSQKLGGTQLKTILELKVSASFGGAESYFLVHWRGAEVLSLASWVLSFSGSQ